MRHLRALKPLLGNSLNTCLNLVLISCLLLGSLVICQLLVFAVIYGDTLYIVDIVNNDKALASVDNASSVTDRKRGSIEDSHLAVLIAKCDAVVKIHSKLVKRAHGNNIGNIITKYH